jgi:plasmid stabilization system protein ParE
VKRLVVLPFAEQDIKDSVSYFKGLENDKEKDFVNILNTSFQEILKNPETYPIAKYDIRKFVLTKYSFCVYYVERVDSLFIIAVFHDKRNPKDWQKRRLKSK